MSEKRSYADQSIDCSTPKLRPVQLKRRRLAPNAPRLYRYETNWHVKPDANAVRNLFNTVYGEETLDLFITDRADAAAAARPHVIVSDDDDDDEGSETETQDLAGYVYEPGEIIVNGVVDAPDDGKAPKEKTVRFNLSAPSKVKADDAAMDEVPEEVPEDESRNGYSADMMRPRSIMISQTLQLFPLRDDTDRTALVWVCTQTQRSAASLTTLMWEFAHQNFIHRDVIVNRDRWPSIVELCYENILAGFKPCADFEARRVEINWHHRTFDDEGVEHDKIDQMDQCQSLYDRNGRRIESTTLLRRAVYVLGGGALMYANASKHHRTIGMHLPAGTMVLFEGTRECSYDIVADRRHGECMLLTFKE